MEGQGGELVISMVTRTLHLQASVYCVAWLWIEVLPRRFECEHNSCQEESNSYRALLHDAMGVMRPAVATNRGRP